MRSLYVLILFVTSMSCPADAQVSEQGLQELRSLPWTQASGLQLPHSLSSLSSLPGFVALAGADAARARAIEDATINSRAEAEILNRDNGAEAVFEYNPVGYVASEDWDKVDTAAMLQQVQENTEIANNRRRLQGLAELHVSGWVQQPSLNSETHTVSWIISASQSSGGSIINAVAMKLGRYGYERITLVDDALHSATAIQNLLLIANAHQFRPGARYNEYVAGADHSAEYGVAGLVAGALGVKLLKVAGGLGFLVLAKKAGVLIILPFYWLWGLIKKRKTASTASPFDDLPTRGAQPEMDIATSMNRKEPHVTRTASLGASEFKSK